MVFLTVKKLILSEFGIKLVPLFTSSVSSNGRLIFVKLWTFLVVEIFRCVV